MRYQIMHRKIDIQNSIIRIFASPYQVSYQGKILTFQLTFIPKHCSKSQLELHAKTYSLDDMNKLLYIHRLDS